MYRPNFCSEAVRRYSFALACVDQPQILRRLLKAFAQTAADISLGRDYRVVECWDDHRPRRPSCSAAPDHRAQSEFAALPAAGQRHD